MTAAEARVSITDSTLIKEFQDGKTSSFEELITRYKEKAVQIAWSLVGNQEDAKDVAQEAFVKAYQALKRFRGDAQFSTWLYRIIVNTAKDHLRRRKWTRFFSSDERQEQNYFEAAVSPDSPAKEIENREIADQLHSAIEKLPQKQKWVFTLRYLQDLSLSEIQQITGQSLGTVKASLHFATIKIREKMAPVKEAKGGRHE